MNADGTVDNKDKVAADAINREMVISGRGKYGKTGAFGIFGNPYLRKFEFTTGLPGEGGVGAPARTRYSDRMDRREERQDARDVRGGTKAGEFLRNKAMPFVKDQVVPFAKEHMLPYAGINLPQENLPQVDPSQVEAQPLTRQQQIDLLQQQEMTDAYGQVYANGGGTYEGPDNEHWRFSGKYENDWGNEAANAFDGAHALAMMFENRTGPENTEQFGAANIFKSMAPGAADYMFNPNGMHPGNNTAIQHNGFAKDGGDMSIGQEFDWTEQEIQEFIANGGELEYI